MPIKVFVATLMVLAVCAAPALAQYENSSRIQSLLRSRFGQEQAPAAAAEPEVPAGSIADKFRQRIAAVHGGTTPEPPTPASTPTLRPVPRRTPHPAPPAGRAGRTEFFSNVERLKREREARLRGEMPYAVHQPTVATPAAVPAPTTPPPSMQPSPRPILPRSRSGAAGSDVRARLQAVRRQSVGTLGAYRRSLTGDEREKLNNWLRKNKFASSTSVRRNGESALHRAISQGNREMATLVLCDGADVDTEDRFGETPLHQAADRGQGDMVELLMSWQADPNIRNDKGEDPLHKAARAGHLAIVQLLLKTVADRNARADDGCTALHYAAQGGYTEVVKALVAAGADMNVRCNANETAVQKAACAGHNDIARLLLGQ